MSHLTAQIARARAEGRIHDAQAMERIEAEELRKKRKAALGAVIASRRPHG